MRVKAGIFNATGAIPDDGGEYLRWHLLDHVPEQFQLPGMVHALRWIMDDRCRDSRIMATGQYEHLANLVHYCIGDPVQRTVDGFLDLGPRLRDMGRWPRAQPSLHLSLLSLLRQYAAPRVLISPEVVAFRPHRGIVALLEEPTDDTTLGQWLRWLHTTHYPELLDVPGVAGAWMFSSTDAWHSSPRWHSGREYITIIYLDEDPVDVTRQLASTIAGRWASGAVKPAFAGPMRSMVQWDTWPPERADTP